MGGQEASPSVVGIKLPRPRGAARNEALTGAGHAEQPKNSGVGGIGYSALATVKERQVCRMDGRKNKDPLTENHMT